MWKKKAKSKGNKILIIYFFVEMLLLSLDA